MRTCCPLHYLIVKRVNAEEYVTMLQDRITTAHDLQSYGIPLTVERKIVLPPPTFEVFSSIMNSQHVMEKRTIESLWTHTGGIPAVALMMSKVINADKGLETIFQ